MAKILGIDISQSSVRAVLVQANLRKTEVLRCVETTLATDSPNALSEGIRTVQDMLGQSYDIAIAHLGGQQVSLRLLQLPRAATRHLQQIIPNELESLLPFDLDDVLFDYQIVSQNTQALRILTASAPRPLIAETLRRLSDAGIELQELAAGAAVFDALPNIIPSLKKPGPVMLINLDLESTDICILKNGTCDTVRTLSTGVAGLPDNASTLGREISQTLAAHRASGGEAPSAVFLMGDGSMSQGATSWMSNLLHLDVDVLELPELPGVLPEHASKFSRALALASRTLTRGKRLNLRSGDFAPTHTLSSLREKSKLFAWCGAAVFVAFLISTYGRYQILGKQHEALETRLAKVTQEVFGQETTDPTLARALLDGKEGEDDPMPKVSAYDILEAVSAAVPQSIVHDTRELRIEIGLGEDRGRLDLEGVLSNNSERAQVANNLRQHACIKDLKEAGTSPAGDGRLRYEIEATLECPGQSSAKKKSRTEKDTHGVE